MPVVETEPGSHFCPECNHEHRWPYFYCQACEAEMPLVPNSYLGVQIRTPYALKRANREGYTMAELRREDYEGMKLREAAGEFG